MSSLKPLNRESLKRESLKRESLKRESARTHLTLLTLLTLLTIQPAHSAQLLINIGSTNNDGTGDTLRSAMQKVNTNFTTLFTSGVGGSDVWTTNNEHMLKPVLFPTRFNIDSNGFTTIVGGFLSQAASTNNGAFYVEGQINPLTDDAYTLGTASRAFSGIYVKGSGLLFKETGGGVDAVNVIAPASLANSYGFTWPNAQGGNGQVMTNDGSGVLGWWTPVSGVGGDAGGTNSRQHGSLNLTNWSLIPTGAMANVVATDFLTNWANAVSNYVTAATNSVSVTNWINFRQPASLNLTNWSLIPTGAMANVVSTTFLTNWANAISNYVTEATNAAQVTNWITLRQPADTDLTNWALIPTGAMANVVSTTFLTNWANAISNYVTAATNAAQVTNWITLRQPADTDLTNWSNIPTGEMANVVSTTFLTNWANAISNYVTAATNAAQVTNWINSRQPANAVLSNLVGTVARNVTNVVSLSTTNATSKPLTNAYANGALTLFGMQGSPSLDVTPNASNLVFTPIPSGTQSTNTGILTTNFFSTTSGFRGGQTPGASIIFYDNFDGPTMGSTGIMQRLSSSGHRYADIREGGAGGTNFINITGGKMVLTNTHADGVQAVYLCWSNTQFQPINYWGLKAQFKYGLGSIFTDTHILNDASAIFGGDFLHASARSDGNLSITRGLSETIVSRNIPGFNEGDIMTVEVFAWTNAVAIRRDGISAIGYTTNTAWAFQPVSIWEILGAGGTNALITAEIDEIWAGYMSFGDFILSQSSYVNTTNLTAGAISGGMYTNDSPFYESHHDSFVGIPNGPQAGRTNWLRDAKLFQNRELIIADIGGTALNSNITVRCMEANQFVGFQGAQTVSTNINIDYGVMWLKSDGSNWIVLYKTPVILDADRYGGFLFPKWKNLSGHEFNVQPSLAHETVNMLRTYGGATIGSLGVGVTTNGGTTVSHNTPIETQPHMVNLAAAATSNATASAWSSVDVANAGAHNGSSKVGGYFFSSVWMSTNLIGQVVGGGAPRTFVGLTAKAAEDYTNIVVTTNSTGQYLGVMCDTKQSATMFISARDSGNEFRTNTGISFVASNIYNFYLYNPNTNRFVGWRLDDVTAGLSASGIFSNNVPTNFMKFGIVTKNGTNRAHDVRFSNLYLQAPLSPPR